MKSEYLILIGVVVLLVVLGFLFFTDYSGAVEEIIKRIEDYGPVFTPGEAPPRVTQSVIPPIVATPQEAAFDRYW